MKDLGEPLFQRGEAVRFHVGDDALVGVVSVVDFGGAWEFNGRCHSYDIMTFDLSNAAFGCDVKHVPEEDVTSVTDQRSALLGEERKALAAMRKALYDVRSAASAGTQRQGTERALMRSVGEQVEGSIEAVEAAMGRIDDGLLIARPQ